MKKLILASASKSRADLLRGAGLDIQAIPADLDENIIKAEGHTVTETALKLSVAKANVLSTQHPDALVIGADQMLECEGQRFDKATNLEEVRNQLIFLRGKAHHLISGVAVVKNGETLWSHHQKASLKMRSFSDAFLDQYIAEMGNDLLSTVGCYRLESKGVQLFEKIEGDYFTILGLPLLAVLDFLRQQDMILA